MGKFAELLEWVLPPRPRGGRSVGTEKGKPPHARPPSAWTRAPFGVYANGECVAEHASGAAARSLYSRLLGRSGA